MRILAAASLLALAACSGYEEDTLEYERVRIDPTPEEINLEPPSSANLEFLAWAADENRALSPWTTSRSSAESFGREYAGLHPGRAWTILWREIPAETMRARYPRP